jgi:hypothetical protein
MLIILAQREPFREIFDHPGQLVFGHLHGHQITIVKAHMVAV